MTSSSDESLTEQVAALREVVRMLMVSTEFEPSARFPWYQFCARQMVGGEAYTRLRAAMDSYFPAGSDDITIAAADARHLRQEMVGAGVGLADVDEAVHAYVQQFHPGASVSVAFPETSEHELQLDDE